MGIRLYVVAYMAALGMIITGGGAIAGGGNGNSADAPGQARAAAHCEAVKARQEQSGHQRGGWKGATGHSDVTNCDQYWSTEYAQP